MESLNRILEYELSEENISALSQKIEGLLDFKSVAHDFQEIRNILVRVKESEKYLLGDDSSTLHASIEELRRTFLFFRSLGTSRFDEPGIAFVEEVENLRRLKLVIYKSSSQAIALGSPSNASVYEETLEDLKEKTNLLSSKLTFLRSDAKDVFVSRTASYYDDLAKTYNSKARRALLALSTMMLAFLYVAIFILVFYKAPLNKSEYYFKAFLISNIVAVAWFALRFQLKTLRVMQHLEVTNRSKAMNLQVGEIYIATANSEKERDDVNKAVIASVFSVDESGFTPQKDASVSPTSNVWLNLSKLVSGKGE